MLRAVLNGFKELVSARRLERFADRRKEANLGPAVLGYLALFVLAAGIVLVSGLVQGAHGEPLGRKCILDEGARSVFLASCAARLVDQDGSLGIIDVSDVRNAARFQVQDGFLSGGYTRAVNWHRLTVERTPKASADWILEMGAPFLDDVRVFVPVAGGGFIETRLGDNVPRDRVPLSSRLHTVQVSLPASTPVDIYVRVASRSALMFSAQMWRPRAFADAEKMDNVIHGAYFGILAIIVFFYSLSGVVLREKTLLFYANSVACIALLYLSLNGFVAMLLVPDRPWLQDYTTELGVLGTNVAFTLMWNAFVEYRKNFPRFWPLFVFTAVVDSACLSAIGSAYYGLAAQVSNLVTFVFSIFSLSMLIVLLRRRWDGVVFLYVLAFILPSAGAVVQLGMTLGYIGRTMLTINVYQAATLSHIALLGLAFVIRLQRIQAEKRRAEQDAMVSSRVAEEQRKVVAMLSHEFRSPLAAIDRAAEMIELGCMELNDAARERIRRIRGHATQMAGLVNVFLTSEALEHGRTALHAEPTGVARIVERLQERFQDEAASGRLAFQDESELHCVQVDTELLCVALGNILENALRYSPPDTMVRFRTHTKDDALLFEVADSGAGMLPEEVEKIGALYFRGKSSTGTNGSGLGLYIARRIIDAHGGQLLVRSRPHGGTTITISLPASLPLSTSQETV